MKHFVALYQVLDASTSTLHKTRAMEQYFRSAPPADAAWAAYFLGGGKPRRTVPTRTLREVTLQITGLSDWLFEECYQAVGDLAETIANLLPDPAQANLPTSDQHHSLSWWMEQRILPLRTMDESDRLAAVVQCWGELTADERFLFVKLVGGGLRVGVSKLLLTRALAAVVGIDPKHMAARLMGFHDANRMPDVTRWMSIVSSSQESDANGDSNSGQPIPFFLAHPLQEDPHTLGHVQDWLAEWKYDGIRAQVVKAQGQVWIWSRGEELITEQFPELAQEFTAWPDGTVLDGEVLVWRDGMPAGFNALQTRLNRKVVGRQLQAEYPVVFMAYDMLVSNRKNVTQQVQLHRRQTLEQFCAQHASQSIVNPSRLMCSPRVQASSWAELAQWRAQSRQRGVEGLMLKHSQSLYGVGRTKATGTWLKWKLDPMSVDCVLVYAQRGHGRRASLYTDYTFAVWDRPPVNADELQAVLQAIANGESVEQTQARGLPRLVPFAKAYSGLTDDEFKQVDAVIRKTTLDKFGPVRTVKPTLVFELGFEAIAPSNRHKSGVAVRFPRMLRLRTDKPLAEADTLSSLNALLTLQGASHADGH